MRYIDKKFVDIVDVLSLNGIPLVLTATSTETEALHQKIVGIEEGKIIRFTKDGNTYYLGLLGKYLTVHVQCSMGSIGRSSSILTVSKAIEHINPKFIIMVGIAFGVDERKQKIGDVFISKSIMPYDSKRVGKDNVISRGSECLSDRLLLNRFENILSWEFKLECGSNARQIFTQVLSGESLVDNKNFRNLLIKNFPLAEGGEMEGIGLASACDGKVGWILVKGICDFADGKKSEDKNKKQNIAINAALDLCMQLFENEITFEEFQVNPYKHVDKIDRKIILFNEYTLESEKYYIEREDDKIFLSNFIDFCLWVHGASGTGKTTLISRNLIKEKKEFILIGLGSYINTSMIEIFQGILIELSLILQIRVELDEKTVSAIFKEIIKLLSKISDRKVVLMIAEIPLSNEKDYKEFIEYFISFLIEKQTKSNLNNIKFILSSIFNPEYYILPHQYKITEKLKFIKLKNWGTYDASRLIDLLVLSLNIKINKDLKEEILNLSCGSPRFIKKFFSNVYVNRSLKTLDYKMILIDTKNELSRYMQ